MGIVLILLIIFFFSRKGFYVFLSLLILLISTNPFVGNYLAQKLEDPYKPIPISSLKENDAVVVLSGMLHQVGDQKYSTYEFSDPDRFFAGIDLIKQQKANKLIFTARNFSFTKNLKPEGFILKNKTLRLPVLCPW